MSLHVDVSSETGRPGEKIITFDNGDPDQPASGNVALYPMPDGRLAVHLYGVSGTVVAVGWTPPSDDTMTWSVRRHRDGVEAPVSV